MVQLLPERVDAQPERAARIDGRGCLDVGVKFAKPATNNIGAVPSKKVPTRRKFVSSCSTMMPCSWNPWVTCESNLASTVKLVSVTGWMSRAALSPSVHWSCAVPAGR